MTDSSCFVHQYVCACTVALSDAGRSTSSQTGCQLKYQVTVGVVEETLVRYPIPLLQVVGTRLTKFSCTRRNVRSDVRGVVGRARRVRVRLLPGVIDRLVVSNPMPRTLIELHWANDNGAKVEHVVHMFQRPGCALT